uniref:Uncharacterized protein n=1 Tax=Rhizophora mucronata TaxID=61149 RepID=A0A2P2J5G3_RHIMU
MFIRDVKLAKCFT